MELKTRGLLISIDENKNLGFCLTDKAVKEFCEYHKITYEDKDIYTNGLVPTKKFFIHQKMLAEFSKIGTCNNWRKMHHLPLIRRKGERK